MLVDGKPFRSVQSTTWSPEDRMRDCDNTKVTVQVLSTVPVMFSYWAKPEDALDLARYLNDHIAQVVGENPKRFIGACVEGKAGVTRSRAPPADARRWPGDSAGHRPRHAADAGPGPRDQGAAPVHAGPPSGRYPDRHVDQRLVPGRPRALSHFPSASCKLPTQSRGAFHSSRPSCPWSHTESGRGAQACEELDAVVFIHPWDMKTEGRFGKYWFPWYGPPLSSVLSLADGGKRT